MSGEGQASPFGPVPGPREPVAIVGLGVSGRAMARHLLGRGVSVTGLDTGLDSAKGETDPDLASLLSAGLRLGLGPGALGDVDRFETVFVTPGMPKQHPDLQRAARAGAYLTGEVPYVLGHASAPTVGITGSAGKTTTTTLVGEILARSGVSAFVGGNIGRPAVEALTPPVGSPFEQVVLELSSFQLDLCRVSPHVGAVLNLAPNHLDVHPSFEDYRRAKLEILAHQGRDDQAVTSADHPVFGANEAGRALRRWQFGLDAGTIRLGTTIVRDAVVYRDGMRETVLFAASEIRLPGLHNRENVLAAALLGLLAGACPEAIREAVAAFRGVPHRLQIVHEAGGIRYIDDSIATAPDRTLAALAAVDGPVVLIAGGSDKGLDFRPLGAALRDRVRVLLTMGITGPAIARSSEEAGGPRAIPCADLTEAVREAKRLARPGDTVLLAPASASFDQFPNYAVRGDVFARLVRAGADEAPAQAVDPA